MPTQDAAGQQDRDSRTEPSVPRSNKAETTARAAANLYALLAWLYDKPKT